MSRYYDALKRVDQERAASRGGQAGPVPIEEAAAPAPPAADPATVSSRAGAVPAAAFAHGMPASGNPLTFDTLLARCAPGRWNPDAKAMLFFNGDENGCGTKEFCTLRSRLYQMREKMTLKKVLVTSPLRKEGKSFVAANLAQVLSQQQGRRVLLIDADLRGPSLHSALGTTSTPGLSEYLLGEKDEFSVIQRFARENLLFIPSGGSVLSPADTVANGRLKTLLQRVEPLFDWVIIDSPPAVAVSDAKLLADHCDGVLMVVRSNATRFEAARKARQEFADKVLVGVVLNGVAVGS